MATEGTEAEELRATIRQIAFDANGKITEVIGLQNELAEIGQRILELRTHNLDVASAGTLLTSSVQEDLKTVNNKLQLVRRNLENFLGLP